MSKLSKQLDEILEVMFNSTRPNQALPKAKQAIVTLFKDICDEAIIGKDEIGDEPGFFPDRADRRNQLRSEQRDKLSELFEESL